MRRSIKNLIAGVIVVGGCLFAYDDAVAAGPPGPPGGGGDPPCWPAPCVPIDGGIGFLIAAGLAYGGKKAYGSIKGKK
ncbi:MAG: hypothetical protein JKX73_04640 [Flavobacteriales bacterium]|nr:hypothetical protein [Flavobacteriales bacterium]